MNFGQAIEEMKAGKKVSRPSWNGKDMSIYIEKRDGFDPCIVMITAQGTKQPGWLANQPDILATDWQLAG